MNKFAVFLLIAVSLLVSVGLSSKTVADNNQFAFVNPIVTPTPLAELENITLDKNEVVYICPWSDYCGKVENLSVVVKTSVRNPKNVSLNYQYKVTGGRLIGQGEEVLWDLKRIRPGTYTITVVIDDGRGFKSETKSTTVSVKECSVCDLPCTCPQFVVSSGSYVKAGRNIIFTANVTGSDAYDITYNWTISQGEIIDGQGTQKITVKTTNEMSGGIKATVKIDSYALCWQCSKEESATTTIIK
jgi:hypothetical protein